MMTCPAQLRKLVLSVSSAAASIPPVASCLQLMHARIIDLCIYLCSCEHVVSVAHDTHHLHIDMSPLCT